MNLLSIPASVRPFRILNFRLTQFRALKQMRWNIEGNELRNGRMMDSICIAFLSVGGSAKFGSDS
jgi:hypothetical protein